MKYLVLVQGSTDSIEPWYQTPYALSDIPQDWQDAWSSASDDHLFLPELNPFIPSNFDLTQVWAAVSNPSLT